MIADKYYKNDSLQLELEKNIQKSPAAPPPPHLTADFPGESFSCHTTAKYHKIFSSCVSSSLSSFQATKYFAACFVFAMPVTHGYYLAKEARGSRSGLMNYGYCHLLRQENSSNVIQRSYDLFFFFFKQLKNDIRDE